MLSEDLVEPVASPRQLHHCPSYFLPLLARLTVFLIATPYLTRPASHMLLAWTLASSRRLSVSLRVFARLSVAWS